MVFFRSLRNMFSKEKEVKPLFNVKAMQGIVPGGMYAGIGFIPGDSNKEWVKEEGPGVECTACGEGRLYYYWQGDYYRYKCDKCGYLDDTGMKYSPEIVEQINKEV